MPSAYIKWLFLSAYVHADTEIIHPPKPPPPPKKKKQKTKIKKSMPNLVIAVETKHLMPNLVYAVDTT